MSRSTDQPGAATDAVSARDGTLAPGIMGTPPVEAWPSLALVSERFNFRYDQRLETTAWQRLGTAQHEFDVLQEVSVQGFVNRVSARARERGVIVGRHAALLAGHLPGWDVATPEAFLDHLWQGPAPRRDVLILSSDLAHLLTLRADLMARVADTVDRYLTLPVRLPVADPAVLWGSGWSGLRGGAFLHRRLMDVREGAWLTLLVDGIDYDVIRLGLRFATSQPGNVIVDVATEHGMAPISLNEAVSETTLDMYARAGRSVLHIRPRQTSPSHGLFVDVGLAQLSRHSRMTPFNEAKAFALRDDGAILFASDTHARDRLHNFGFVSSRGQVFSQGLMRSDPLPEVRTRLGDMSDGGRGMTAARLLEAAPDLSSVVAVYTLARIGERHA
jgi:hypothetical protein